VSGGVNRVKFRMDAVGNLHIYCACAYSSAVVTVPPVVTLLFVYRGGPALMTLRLCWVSAGSTAMK